MKKVCLIFASIIALFILHGKCFAGVTMEKGKIYILPIGETKKSEIAWLCDDLKKEFKLPCAFLPSRPIPKGAYDKRRGQYHSTIILNNAAGFMPGDGIRLLAVASVDLYVPELNFVFGEASPVLKTAVISTIRLYQSTYGLPEDKALFKRRLLTEAVHELGHTFGLGHCNNPHCVMYFSNTLSDTDRKGPHFCESCKKLIKGR